MLRLTGIAILIGSAAIMAAPVPKQDPLQARIQKLFGEYKDPDHCAECSMNAENQLSLTLRDGASQLWADEDDKKKGIAKSPLTRMIAKGDFDATVHLRLSGFPDRAKNVGQSFKAGMYISSDATHFATFEISHSDFGLGTDIYGNSRISINDGKRTFSSGVKNEFFETTAWYTLTLNRRGDRLLGSINREDQGFKWRWEHNENDNLLHVAMNETVSVGIFASSTNKGFTATFDSFKITPVKDSKP